MPRIIIWAPAEQDQVHWFAAKAAEIDPSGVVVVTADFAMDQAMGIVRSMQLLSDDEHTEDPCPTSQDSPE